MVDEGSTIVGAEDTRVAGGDVGHGSILVVRSEVGRLDFFYWRWSADAPLRVFNRSFGTRGMIILRVYPMLGNMGLLSMGPSRDRKRQAFRPARLVNTGFRFRHAHQATIRNWP